MLQNADTIKYVGDKNKDSGKHSKNSQHRSRRQGNSEAQNTNMLLLMINQNQSQHFWVVVCVTLVFNMWCLLMGVLTVLQLNINKWYFPHLAWVWSCFQQLWFSYQHFVITVPLSIFMQFIFLLRETRKGSGLLSLLLCWTAVLTRSRLGSAGCTLNAEHGLQENGSASPAVFIRIYMFSFKPPMNTRLVSLSHEGHLSHWGTLICKLNGLFRTHQSTRRCI